MVGGDGGVRQWLIANSRDGLLDHHAELALRRVRVVPKMFSEARAAPGTVFRYDTATGEQIFVVRHPVDELPARWWSSVFESIDHLVFGGEISLNREPVASSSTPLDLTAGPGRHARAETNQVVLLRPA
jgi:hypothetical protein